MAVSVKRLHTHCDMHCGQSCIDGPLLSSLCLLWFLLAQIRMFIIAITLRPHSDQGLICSQQEAGDIQ